MIAFNAVPKVAVVPILIIWFGIGTIPAIFTAFLIPSSRLSLTSPPGSPPPSPSCRTYCVRSAPASSTWCAKWYSALHALLFSARSRSPSRWPSSDQWCQRRSESTRAKMMLDAQAGFNVELVFAGVAALAILGIALTRSPPLVEKRFTGWAFRAEELANRPC